MKLIRNTLFILGFINFIIGCKHNESKSDVNKLLMAKKEAPVVPPFLGNYNLVEALDIAMVWTAPSTSSSCKAGSTPVEGFPESICMAVATYSADTAAGNFSALTQKGAGLLSQFLLNEFYDPSALNFNVKTATGDFNGDGRADLITVAYNSKSNKIEIHTGSGTTAEIITNFKKETTNSFSPGPAIGIATGNFKGGEKEDAIITWIDSKLNIQYLEIDTNMNVTLGNLYKTSSFTNKGFYPQVAINGGDFNGDGISDVGLAWSEDCKISSRTTKIKLSVYSVDSSGVIDQKAILSGGELAVYQPSYNSTSVAVAGQLDLVHGSINNNQAEALILAYGNPSSSNISGTSFAKVKPMLKIYTATSDLTDLSLVSSKESSTEWDFVYEGLAVGDFDLDLIDEIVVSYAGYIGETEKFDLEIFSLNSNTELTSRAIRKSSNFIEKTAVDFPGAAFWNLADIAVGDLNADLKTEIVAAWRPSSKSCFSCIELAVFTVSPDLSSITLTKAIDQSQQTMSYVAGPSKWIGGHVSLTLGDFSGRGIWVGPPTKHRVNKSRSIVALINEPPKHEDWWMDSTGKVVDSLNINNNSDSYVLYQNAQSQTTEMSLSLQRGFSYSDELAASLGYKELFELGGSIKATYGEDFTNKYDSLERLSFGSNVYAQMDDYIVLLELGYTVWEYPTYTGTTDTAKGTILVVFPDNPSGDQVLSYLQGTQLGSYYRPAHETGNLLSYSPKPPIDIDNMLLKQLSKFQLGPGGKADQFVDWTKIVTKDSTTSQEQSLTTKESANFNFTKFFTFGLNLELEQSYTKSEISTVSSQFERSTSIHIYMSSFPNRSFSYSVTPYVYWSQYGYIVVDYQVDIPTPTPANGWKTKYGTLPDPAFSLPMRSISGGTYNAFTREISVNEDANGNPISITANINNYSLLPSGVNNVKVRCYLGDPDNGGTQIGTDQLIPKMVMQGTGSVNFQWKPSKSACKTSDPCKIYCVIDPDNELNEIHKWNNKAWAKYPADETN